MAGGSSAALLSIWGQEDHLDSHRNIQARGIEQRGRTGEGCVAGRTLIADWNTWTRWHTLRSQWALHHHENHVQVEVCEQYPCSCEDILLCKPKRCQGADWVHKHWGFWSPRKSEQRKVIICEGGDDEQSQQLGERIEPRIKKDIHSHQWARYPRVCDPESSI